jgi:hypothetical protein
MIRPHSVVLMIAGDVMTSGAEAATTQGRCAAGSASSTPPPHSPGASSADTSQHELP